MSDSEEKDSHEGITLGDGKFNKLIEFANNVRKLQKLIQTRRAIRAIKKERLKNLPRSETAQLLPTGSRRDYRPRPSQTLEDGGMVKR